MLIELSGIEVSLIIDALNATIDEYSGTHDARGNLVTFEPELALIKRLKSY